jgi:glucokinase
LIVYLTHCHDFRHLPYGGLYIAGGLAPKLLPRLREVLVSSYLTDPVMHDLVASFPLYVVTNEFVGLLGATVRAHRLLLE